MHHRYNSQPWTNPRLQKGVEEKVRKRKDTYREQNGREIKKGPSCFLTT